MRHTPAILISGAEIDLEENTCFKYIEGDDYQYLTLPIPLATVEEIVAAKKKGNEIRINIEYDA